MKLCLGAGYEKLGEEWIRVDLDPNTNPDHRRDVRDLPQAWTGIYSEIRAVDILEHLSYRDTVDALKEWARVLRPGGRMFVQVPAADIIMHSWWENARWMKDKVPPELRDAPPMVWTAWLLLGGHFDGQFTRDDSHWYLNAHHALFDRDTIRWAAKEAGLEIETIEVNPHPNYLVWMVKP